MQSTASYYQAARPRKQTTKFPTGDGFPVKNSTVYRSRREKFGDRFGKLENVCREMESMEKRRVNWFIMNI